MYLRYLFEAWNNFTRARKNKELLICGDVDKSVSGIFEKYRYKTKINTVGFVEPAEYYRKASILVYPSLTDGFEKVTLEAMSSGLPIITTTNTGAASIIREGKEGFVVPIRDSKSMEKHILYFYDNPSEVKRMGKNARKLAEKYNWDNFSKRMCKLFEMAYESGRNK